MKYIILILLLFTSLAWAEPPISEKYSHKDFTNVVMTDAKDIKDITIVGSCFYREGVVDSHSFPEDMEGVVFVDCNLDNIYVNETKNIIKGGTHKKIKVANDLSDWVLDKDGKFIEPIDKEERIKQGISILPKDMPLIKQTKNVFEIKKEADAKITP